MLIKSLQNTYGNLIYLFPLALFLGSGISEAILSIISLLFVLFSFLYRDFKAYRNQFFIVALIFWVYIVFRSLFADHPLESLSRSLPFIRFPLFTLAVITLTKSNKDFVDKFIKSLIITLSFTSINLIIQYLLGYNMLGVKIVSMGDSYFRLTTLTGKITPGILTATISFPAICFTISKLVNRSSIESSLIKFTYIIFLLLILLAILLSGERMALLITLTGYLIILITIVINHSKIVIISITLLILSIACVTLVSPKIMYRQVQQASTAILNFSDTSYFRIYRIAYKVALENVIFGVGTKNFQYKCKEIVINEPLLAMYSNLPCGTHPHNIYLEIFSENGLIGLFIFIIMITVLLLNIKSNFKNIVSLTNPVLLGATINFLLRILPIIGGSSLYFTWSSYSIWLMAGLIYGLSEPQFLSKINLKAHKK